MASYKTLPPHDESFALLRKSERLEHLLPPHPVQKQEKQCVECSVTVSPFWHWMDFAALDVAHAATGMNGTGGPNGVGQANGDERMEVDGEAPHSAPARLPVKDGRAGQQRRACHQCWFRLQKHAL